MVLLPRVGFRVGRGRQVLVSPPPEGHGVRLGDETRQAGHRARVRNEDAFYVKAHALADADGSIVGAARRAGAAVRGGGWGGLHGRGHWGGEGHGGRSSTLWNGGPRKVMPGVTGTKASFFDTTRLPY